MSKVDVMGDGKTQYISRSTTSLASKRSLKAFDFDFVLPSNLVTQDLPLKRGEARLLVLHRKTQEIHHRCVSDLPTYLEGKIVYVNNSSPRRAWLTLRAAHGAGELQAYLIRPLGPCRWLAFLRFRPKESQGGLTLGDGTPVRVEESLGAERFILGFDKEVDLGQEGHYMLGPRWTLHREIPSSSLCQAVYSRIEGSFIPPSAGVHLTHELVLQLRVRELTLHVRNGWYGLPSGDELPSTDHGEAEEYEIPEPPQGPAVAIGTTSAKALETWAQTGQSRGFSNLFICPGFEFQVVEALLTVLHRPRQTLLLLVSAFGGHDLVMRAYREAVKNKYRFGYCDDLMLIL